MPSKFEGFAELSSKLATLSDDQTVASVLAPAIRAALIDVKKKAAAYLPDGIDPHKTYKGRTVAPGFARRSIRVLVKKHKTGEQVAGLIGVRAEAFYALQFVELGTSKMAARPWLRPAFLQSENAQIREIAQGMKAWIEDLARRHETTAGSKGAARAAVLRGGIA